MSKINLKFTHKPIIEFYAALENFQKLAVKHELAIKTPFRNLLDAAAKQLSWTLIPEYAYKKKRVDGAVVDEYNLPRGYWEAKDSEDDLAKEIKKKFAANGSARRGNLRQRFARDKQKRAFGCVRQSDSLGFG